MIGCRSEVQGSEVQVGMGSQTHVRFNSLIFEALSRRSMEVLFILNIYPNKETLNAELRTFEPLLI